MRKIIDAQFQEFLKRIRQRQNRPLDWFLHSHSPNFAPDYLTLGRFGRSRKEAVANAALSKMLAPIWNRTIWKRVCHRSLHLLGQKYAPKAFAAGSEEFMAHVRAALASPPVDIHRSTFTELIQFLGECLRHCGSGDLFSAEKEAHTRRCLELYREIRAEILERPDALEIACFLSLRANWIDCVEDNVDAFLMGFFDEVNDVLDHGIPEESRRYFHFSAFRDRLTKPQNILFELDNAGEAVIDLILVEILLKMGHKVVLAAKKEPVLNDITGSELRALLKHPQLAHLGAEIRLSVIDNGSSIAGKYAWHAGLEYKNAYRDASFLLVKGQGHFQTMPMGMKLFGKFLPYPYKKPVFYMMGVKAPIIRWCLESVFSKKRCPSDQSVFFYHFDPAVRETYPK